MELNMKIKITVFLFVFFYAISAQALRCGTYLVQIGDHENEIKRKCGKPLSYENIGYVDSISEGTRVTAYKIEELIYKKMGRFYYLTFKGNKLSNIQDSK